jgi:hypothetical protein
VRSDPATAGELPADKGLHSTSGRRSRVLERRIQVPGNGSDDRTRPIQTTGRCISAHKRLSQAIGRSSLVRIRRNRRTWRTPAAMIRRKQRTHRRSVVEHRRIRCLPSCPLAGFRPIRRIPERGSSAIRRKPPTGRFCGRGTSRNKATGRLSGCSVSVLARPARGRRGAVQRLNGFFRRSQRGRSTVERLFQEVAEGPFNG